MTWDLEHLLLKNSVGNFIFNLTLTELRIINFLIVKDREVPVELIIKMFHESEGITMTGLNFRTVICRLRKKLRRHKIFIDTKRGMVILYEALR